MFSSKIKCLKTFIGSSFLFFIGLMFFNIPTSTMKWIVDLSVGLLFAIAILSILFLHIKITEDETSTKNVNQKRIEKNTDDLSSWKIKKTGIHSSNYEKTYCQI